MRKFKRLLTMISLCLSVMLVVPIIAPKIPSSVTVEAATKVKLNKSKATLFTGKTLQLKLNGAKGKVTWSSSKKSVATVSKSGKVKAKKNGTATITAKYQGKKYKCIITVKKAVPLKSIKLNKSSVKLEVDDYVQLKVKYNPSNTTVDKEIKWTSSNKNIVSVDEDGFIYANSTGTAKITAKVGGKKATCKVTVKTIDVESILVNKISLSMYLGQTDTLKAIFFPSNATDTSVTWKSENNNVATVDSNGHVKAIGVGNTNIIARSNNGKTSKCNVTVKSNSVEKITLNKTYLELKEGKSEILTAVVTPSYAGDKTLTWSTSNADVATVNNGVVTAIGSGEAIITAMANDGSGRYASCRIIVKKVAKLELKNTLPAAFSYLNYNGTIIYSTVNITDMTYEFIESSYRQDLHICLSGKKTYDREGSSVSSTSYVGYKIYDSAGNVAYSGKIYKSGLAVGDTFTNAKEVIYDVPIDHYTIELLNYK